MSNTFRVMVLGVRDGFTKDQVVSALATLFERPQAEIIKLFDVAGGFGQGGLSGQQAAAAHANLQHMGCVCLVEEETRPRGFKEFVGLGAGIVFKAPLSWDDTSSKTHFQVTDPLTDAQFTGSGYANQQATLQEWVAMRTQAVSGGMPFMKMIQAPQAFQGSDWTGFIAEYQGRFPGHEFESRYLVVYLQRRNVFVAFTITVDVENFKRCEPLYRWLLKNNLHLYGVVRVSP